MKVEALRKLLKEVVREVIQEELKEILLEALKSPKQTIVNESQIPQNTPPPTFQQPTADLRQKYKDAMGETAMSFTTNDVTPFRPPTADPINGNLGEGEVGMDQIMNLLNTK